MRSRRLRAAATRYLLEDVARALDIGERRLMMFGGTPSVRPLIVVLMATHNGAAFVDEQVRSVLEQEDVDVRIVVSDDASTDETPRKLRALSADPRVVTLPSGEFGSASANFFRLMLDADVSGADAIAFADQDDVWHTRKLADQWHQLERFDAVSSNVTAVFGQRRILIRKAQPQRELDFVFESAGPGCTFLLAPAAFSEVVRVVQTAEVDGLAHDWLVYAIVRARGMRWHIDPASTVDYRQHSHNARGANVGVAQARIRLREMRSGDHRAQTLRIARLSANLATGVLKDRVTAIAALIASDSRDARRALAARVVEFRRNPRDQIALRWLMLRGLW